jgi:uncharacterized protein (TIGR02145 family)
MVLRFFMLAGVFLFMSCGTIERDNPNDPNSDNYRGYQIIYPPPVEQSSSSDVVYSSSSNNIPQSSSSVMQSSSSISQSSSSVVQSSSNTSQSSSSISSSSGCTAANNNSTEYCSNGTMKKYGFVTYEERTYKTVGIGTQTWMAENLNYNASGSKCYNNLESNCDKYGKLYNFATAMEICPPSWHLPTDADWDKLYRYVDGTNGTGSPYGSSTAGKYLKTISGNGTDIYGFAALLGGTDDPGGNSCSVGSCGSWWVSSNGGNPYIASVRYMYADGTYTYCDYAIRSSLYSVRCVKD